MGSKILNEAHAAALGLAPVRPHVISWDTDQLLCPQLLGEDLELDYLPRVKGVNTRGCNRPMVPLGQVDYQLRHLADSPTI